MKKYTLTNESIIVNGKQLFRIKALRDFGDVVTGELGGFVEKEDNLSHEGNCWIFDNAKCYDNGKVLGNAFLFDQSTVFDNAIVTDDVYLFDNTKAYGNAKLIVAADVYNDTEIFGNAVVGEGATITENGCIRTSEDYQVVTDGDTFISFFRRHDGSIGMTDSISCENISLSDYVEAIRNCFANEINESEEDED